MKVMRNSHFYILIGLFGLLQLGAFYLYYSHFGHNGISWSVQEWGVFGDYIGGVSSVILGITNIIVLVYISILVSKHEDRRWVNELVYELLKSIRNKVNEIKPSEYNVSVSKETRDFIFRTLQEGSFLFVERRKDFQDICFEFSETLVLLDHSSSKLKKFNCNYTDIPYRHDQMLKPNNLSDDSLAKFENLAKCFYEFMVARHRLFEFMNLYIFNNHKKINKLVKMDIAKEAKKQRSAYEDIRRNQLKYLHDGSKIKSYRER